MPKYTFDMTQGQNLIQNPGLTENTNYWSIDSYASNTGGATLTATPDGGRFVWSTLGVGTSTYPTGLFQYFGEDWYANDFLEQGLRGIAVDGIRVRRNAGGHNIQIALRAVTHAEVELGLSTEFHELGVWTALPPVGEWVEVPTLAGEFPPGFGDHSTDSIELKINTVHAGAVGPGLDYTITGFNAHDIDVSTHAPLADVLRLDVEQEPTGLVNLIENPSGELGGYGWVTPVPGSNLTATGYDLAYTTAAGPDGDYLYTEPLTVTAGQYAAAAWHVTGTDYGYSRGRLDWLKADLTANGSTAWTSLSTYGDANLPAVLIPAGTAYARLRLEPSGPNGVYPNTVAGRHFSFEDAVVATAPTAAELADITNLQPITYADILGDSSQISLAREELNLGTITATVLNPQLDPSIADTIRPGRRYRLAAYNPDTAQHEPLIRGRLTNATVDYYPLNDARRFAKITLTGTDNASQLANAKRPDTVGTIDDLPYVLEGTGVPWNVNGSSQQVAAATVIVTNDNASALDQVALTRDTELGYAWVDRWGTLQAWSSLDATDPTPIGPDVYNTNIVIDYDTDRCINSVGVLRQWTHPTEGAEGTLYGPYNDDQSVAEWGLHYSEINVAGLPAGNIPAYAAAVLQANSQPARRVQSLEVTISGTDKLRYGFLDLYNAVRVTNTETNTDVVLRITGITHTIEANADGGRWQVKLEFASEGVVATPTAQPAIAGKAIPSDTGAMTCSNGFTGSFRAVRQESVVTIVGEASNDSLTGGVWTNTGVVLPVGMRPLKTVLLSRESTWAQFNALGYQLLPDGRLQCRRDSPSGQVMALAAPYFVD